MAKRGREAKHHKGPDGIIVGLRKDKKSGRFYPVGKGSPNFGTDEAKAIHRFRVWQAHQGEQPKPSVPITLPATVESFDAAFSQPTILITRSAPETFTTDLETVKRQERKRIRDLIYSNPIKAATELDCEPVALLANVENLKPPQPSKRLAEFCETYLDDKALSRDESTSSRTWWGEFLSITKAKTVTDLDRDSFRKYRKTIKDRQGDHSNAWVRSRFGKIKTIINHALIELELTEREKLILSDVALLKKPSKPTPKPCDISPQKMEAILSRADKWDKGLILLSLNAAYTNVDCAALRWDIVNFEDGTIRFDREKSVHLTTQPLPRICSLWKRTIKALQALKNGHTNVFVSSRGEPPHRNTITRRFGCCCEKAGVVGRTFKHLRKSALTAASNDPTVPDRQIDLLAGHSSGIKEHYVVRKNVQLACEAIERYYFGVAPSN